MVPFDPPQKISENQMFSHVYRGVKREHWEKLGEEKIIISCNE